MASSAVLEPSRPFLVISARSLPLGPGPERPHFHLPVLLPCRLPYPAGPAECDCFSPSALAFTSLSTGSASRNVHAKVGSRMGVFSRDKVRFMLRPGKLLALHRPGLLHWSFRAEGHPISTSNMTTRAHSQFPRPVLHRLDKQPCGLHDRPPLGNSGTAHCNLGSAPFQGSDYRGP